MKREAYTLVEILVVVAIVASLTGLLLVGVQASREAVRRTQCTNNLRNIVLGVESHVSAHQHYPTGGWGWGWRGEPDFGYGREQPGGWAYNLLPFLDSEDVRDLGRRGRAEAIRQAELGTLLSTQLRVFRCPTRGGAALVKFRSDRPPRNAPMIARIAVTDFAANSGDRREKINSGPETYADGNNGKYEWPASVRLSTGIVFMRSIVRPADITDGLSNTYLLGEKRVTTSVDRDWGYDQSMYSGHDYDLGRWCDVDTPPLPDGPTIEYEAFGSSHTNGCLMATADGSVRLQSYDGDPIIHQRRANRSDHR